MHRRSLFSTFIALFVGSLAGCVGFVRRDETDATCLDEYRRLDDELDGKHLEANSAADAVITVELSPVIAGESFEVTLTNESDDELTTTGEDRYAFQRKASSSWSTIVGVQSDLEWDNQETILDPGEQLA